MKTFIVAIIFFIIWSIFWWIIWINTWLNFGFDSLTSWFKESVDMSLSWYKYNNLSWSYDRFEDTINKQKNKFINQLKTKKYEIIQNIQNEIKNKLKEQIDNLF